jgi:hypothetical protein
MAGCSECGDEPSSYCATELVILSFEIDPGPFKYYGIVNRAPPTIYFTRRDHHIFFIC